MLNVVLKSIILHVDLTCIYLIQMYVNYYDLHKSKIKQTCIQFISAKHTSLYLTWCLCTDHLKRWNIHSSQHFILVPSQEFSAQFYFQSTQAYHRLQTKSRGHSQEPHSLYLLLSCSLHLCDASRNPICLQKKDMEIQI